MTDQTKEGLSAEELETQSGEALPDREAMSVVWIEPDVLPPEDGKQLPIDHNLEQGVDRGEPVEPLQGGEQL